jgi:hypothetical protein
VPRVAAGEEHIKIIEMPGLDRLDPQCVRHALTLDRPRAG